MIRRQHMKSALHFLAVLSLLAGAFVATSLRRRPAFFGVRPSYSVSPLKAVVGFERRL